MSKFNGVKTNNAKTTAKEEIRVSVMRQIKNASVLEVFCGSGEMYQKVWHEAQRYTGIDKVKQFDARHTICGDAQKAVRKIDLNKYNIYDIDAYGSPYEILDFITSQIITSRRIGFVITDGIDMDLKLGRVCKGVRAMTGIKNHILKRANTMHDDLIMLVIKEVEERLNGKASCLQLAKGKTGSAMRYYSFIIDRDAALP